ncbi:hypothetical protein, partial [Bordetella genomosp. 13]|uniref:hypothetical protein n=1 Tax=Bordetella genomosp. 13 TaxID=463040 RepID=UPI001C92F1BB
LYCQPCGCLAFSSAAVSAAEKRDYEEVFLRCQVSLFRCRFSIDALPFDLDPKAAHRAKLQNHFASHVFRKTPRKTQT